jgi:hypothetical protein
MILLTFFSGHGFNFHLNLLPLPGHAVATAPGFASFN